MNSKQGLHGWQDVVSKGHRIMILYCGEKVEIRLPNDRDHQRNGKDVKPFDIMDGFDFRILDPDGYEKQPHYKGYSLYYLEID